MLCLLLAGIRKKRKRKKRNEKQLEAFFPGPEARYALLAMLGGIFEVVRCNERLV
jgi:hypothetical protein